MVNGERWWEALRRFESIDIDTYSAYHIMINYLSYLNIDRSTTVYPL